MRSMVEGAPTLQPRGRWAPSTTPLRVAVPLPVPGRSYLRARFAAILSLSAFSRMKPAASRWS
jgi:hypothetical protein